jgi:PRC-barrel domain
MRSRTAPAPDYRGWTVYGADRIVVGTIDTLVQSRAAGNAEYFVVALDGGQVVLVPVAYARINMVLRRVTLRSLTARGCQALPVYGGEPLTEGLEDVVWWVFVTAEEAAEEDARRRSRRLG